MVVFTRGIVFETTERERQTFPSVVLLPFLAALPPLRCARRIKNETPPGVCVFPFLAALPIKTAERLL